MFLVYALLGVVALVLYSTLSPDLEPQGEEARAPLGESKAVVYKLAALFSLDSFAGGFVVQSMLALWLFERFNLSVGTAGTIFFFTNLLTAFSYLASARLAKRIGLVNTMVFTHLPANIFLLMTPFMPTVQLAVVFLMLRSALSSMDVPARSSYVMAVVTPPERPAAASITAVPRSLAAAIGPFFSGVSAWVDDIWMAAGHRWFAESDLRSGISGDVQAGQTARGTGLITRHQRPCCSCSIMRTSKRESPKRAR